MWCNRNEGKHTRQARAIDTDLHLSGQPELGLPGRERVGHPFQINQGVQCLYYYETSFNNE